MCFINPICENYLCVLDNCPWHNGRAGCLPAHSPGCPENQHIHSSHYLFVQNSLNPENIYIGQCVQSAVCVSELSIRECPLSNVVNGIFLEEKFIFLLLLLRCCDVVMYPVYKYHLDTRRCGPQQQSLDKTFIISFTKHRNMTQTSSKGDPASILYCYYCPHATIFYGEQPLQARGNPFVSLIVSFSISRDNQFFYAQFFRAI